MKRSLSILLTVCMLLSLLPIPALGVDATAQLAVTGRGGESLFQSDAIALGEGETALTLLLKGMGEDRLDIVYSSYGAYLNGAQREDGTWLRAGDDGAYSGWMYRVNGVDAMQSAEYFKLNMGDRVEFYYTDGSTPAASLGETIAAAADYLFETIPSSYNGWFYKDWQVIALGGAGVDIPAEYTEKTAPELVKKLTSPGVNITDLERFVLSFGLAGNDVRNFQGFDLVEMIYNCDEQTMLRQGNNGPLYAALILHSLDYEVPADAVWTKEKLLQTLADTQNSDGGFALSPGDESDIDITAMVIQALAFDRATYQPAIDKAVAYLSAQQKEDGGYVSDYSGNSAESVSQVIIALTAVGINPETDMRFNKNFNNLLTKLKTYQMEDGGFAHVMREDGASSDSMATSQAIMALSAYKKMQEGKGHSFDYRELGLSISTAIPASSKNQLRTAYLEGSELSLEGFSASSVQRFQQSLEAAGTVLSDPQASAGAIGQAADELAAARAALTDKEYAILSVETAAVGGGFVLAPTRVEVKGDTTLESLLKAALGDRVTFRDGEVVSIRDGGEAGEIHPEMKRKLTELGITAQQRKADLVSKGDVTAQSKFLVQNGEAPFADKLVRVAFSLADGKDVGFAAADNLFPAVSWDGAFRSLAALNALDRTLYGQRQAAKLDAEITAASAALNTPGVTQQKLDEISSAVDRRVREVPKKALEEQIAVALEKQDGNYTASSLKTLKTCLATAEQAFENIAATQMEVSAATSALSDAIANLKSDSGSGVSDTVRLTVTLSEIGKGTMINNRTVSLAQGDTVYDVLEREVGKENLQTTGDGDNIYVAGIQYNGVWYREFDYGSKSGWIYTVNGVEESRSAGAVKLKRGDVVKWNYEKTPSTGGFTGGTGGGSVVVKPTPAPTPTPAPQHVKVEEAFKQLTGKMQGKEELTEWEIFTLARLNLPVPSQSVETLKSAVKEQNGDFRKVTDLERYILALTALGYDAGSFEGLNLIEKMLNHENMLMQGVNGPAFALIALDSADYATPAGTQWNRETLQSYILESQNSDGSFGLEKGGDPDPDLTAMAVQALSTYQDNTRVRESIDKAIAWMASAQQDNGLFLAGGAETSETLVQLIVALTALGEDPEADSRFTKNGKNLVDLLYAFQVRDGVFAHVMGDGGNEMATEQAFYAFAALKLLYDGEEKLFSVNRAYLDQDKISDWALDAVRQAKEQGIMTGDDQNIFHPQDCLTRAELTKVLCQLFGLDITPERTNPFEDVGGEAWYQPYVLACFEKGYVKGTSGTTFSPDDLLTREEIAVMVARAMGLSSAASHDLSDGAEISDWALDAVQAVIEKGIMIPDEGYFDPKGNVTREMAAVIAVRLTSMI